MKILIESANIFSPSSKWHLKKANVLIANGKIKSIGKSSYDHDKKIIGNGKWLTPGWFDSWAHFNDPGFENKEDIQTGREAASHGGFTAVMVIPNNNPVTDSKNQIKYLTRWNDNELVKIYPIAAVTKGIEGNDLTEMIDLMNAGAMAYSDGLFPLRDSQVLLKALQYLHQSNSVVIQQPEDVDLNNSGSMNEGIPSTLLGLKGIPTLAEEVMIQRDLSILEYAGGKLHFVNVSTEKGLDMIRKAKKSGLNVTCSVASYQTEFSDEEITPFDTYCKVRPPIRSNKDKKAILKALKDGTIDVINSNHLPQDVEGKKLEFDLAEFGMISIQTVASNIATLSEDVPMEELLYKITVSPRIIFGVEIPEIKEGSKAELTLFDPNLEWKLEESTNRSKSVNSPFMDKKMKGKATFVCNGKFYLINE